MWLPIIFGIHNPVLAYQVEPEIVETKQLDKPLISLRIEHESRGKTREFSRRRRYIERRRIGRGRRGVVKVYGNCGYPVCNCGYPVYRKDWKR